MTNPTNPGNQGTGDPSTQSFFSSAPAAPSAPSSADPKDLTPQIEELVDAHEEALANFSKTIESLKEAGFEERAKAFEGQLIELFQHYQRIQGAVQKAARQNPQNTPEQK
jgi:hypothetical protein